MKNIIITGASGGIGKEIVKTLAKKNTRLILLYNSNSSEVESLKNNLEKTCEIVVYKCNLTNVENVNKMVNHIIKHFKTIDVLVNCAGKSKFQQIQDLTEQDYHEIMDLNLKSVMLLISLVSKNMISNKSGKIINIYSMWRTIGASMESLYSASKGAINTLTLSLAKELGPSNIRVNCLAPGLIDTDMNSNLSNDAITDLINNTPLNKIGTPEDVANAALFLASDKASFITGQTISIDGGFIL
jgi:3-oxoacyl-[acyl-carrier protein] reductase